MATAAPLRAACLAALLAAAAAAGRDPEAPAKTNAVERVVKLLQELKEKISTDGKEDQRLYDKYACWCEITSKRKAATIHHQELELRQLGQKILKLKGLIATRKAEIEELKAKIAKTEEAIAMLTAIRSKENAKYVAESGDMQQAITALEQAIDVLKKATRPTLLQDGSASAVWRKAAARVEAAVAKMPPASLSPDRAADVSAFLEKASSTDARAGYAPQSATVQGILAEMYGTFSADLEDATSEEATKNREYEGLIYEKHLMIAQLTASMAKKEKELAEYEVQLADTQTLYDNTDALMKETIEFFDQLKAMCEAKHEEYTLRASQREEELKGIAKALEILTSDEAREMLMGSVAFFQVGSAGPDALAALTGAGPAMKAYNALKVQAKQTQSLRLASLAATVRLAKAGHFDKVISAIDEMIGVLKDEEADDIEKRDSCKDEFQAIASTSADLSWKIERNLAQIGKLEELIKAREDAKQEAIEEYDDVQLQIADMKGDRLMDHEEWLADKEHGEESIRLLVAARDALAKYYAKNKISLGPIQGSVKAAGLTQQEPEFAISKDQAPDATFTHKGSRKNEAKGIISLLTMIIEQGQDAIKKSVESEEADQRAFEKSLATAEALQAELDAKVKELKGIIARRKEEWNQEHETKKENEEALAEKKKYKKDIEPDCNWIINAFDERALKRKAEMDGLVAAKEFLVGAQPPSEAMLQGEAKPVLRRRQ